MSSSLILVSRMLTCWSCHGHEIREQLERIAHKSNIQGQFCTSVTHQRWNDEAKLWVVTLSHKLSPDQEPEKIIVRAQFLLLAGGIQTSAHAPKLNGIDVFRSASNKIPMHTARWDWSKNGGSQESPEMIKLQGKRVGIVGTGATAVQVAPHLAKWAKHTYIFQRTPSYVGPRPQKETTTGKWTEVAYKPGWQYERMESLDAIFSGKPDAEDKIRDSWTKMSGMRALAGYADRIITPDKQAQHVKDIVNVDYPWTEEMRRRVDAEVRGPSIVQKLKAWFL